MSFCMIFLISLMITSICLGRCGCIPYHYFGNCASGVVNLDICGQSNVNGLKTHKEVSETKSTVMNLPTRGLFYPDDMFFTNWAPRVLTTDCSEKQSSVITPSGSIFKCTSKITKNYEKTKILPTTVSQKNSSLDQKSSLGNKKTTLSLKSSPFDRHKFTRGHRRSTRTRLQKTTVNRQKFSADAVQMSTKVHLQNSSRKLQKSSREKSTTLRKSTRGSKKSSTIHQKVVEKSNVAATTPSYFDYYADDSEDTTIN
ncbi:cell wall protein RBR3-like [Aphis craccivora]|uniref:Cell wall protein RBR3-like n=1 Tax=Aphis craccivora TaxID=307492 RepID=A0A6G0YCV6_APHCR|nr:cell wall protein RBR3-like [Aphis craccivora]